MNPVSNRKVQARSLKDFLQQLFVLKGLSEKHASTFAESLVWANLRGIDTHGVSRIVRYLELLDSGEMNATPSLRIEAERLATALVESNAAPGPVAMGFAADVAADKARQCGIGMALIQHTTHTGAIGSYAHQLAEQGMASIVMSASLPMMPYHGARSASVGTNPVAIGVPMGDESPMVLDMSTAVVPLGRLLQARKLNLPLKPGWAVDANGEPTEDADKAVSPLPLGGPKGSGLSLMIECLTSVLASSPILSDWVEKNKDGMQHRQNALVIAIDVSAFRTLPSFTQEVSRLVHNLKSLDPVDPAVAIAMPGERGAKTFLERSRHGIPIPAPVWADIMAVSKQFGIELASEA